MTWWRAGCLSLLAFCSGVAFFASPGASWAAESPAPYPTEAQGAVPDVWRCEDLPVPSPTATVTPDPTILYDEEPDPPIPTATITEPPHAEPSPTATDTRCRVTSWATPAPLPTPTVTSTPVSTDPAVVTLAPSQFDRFNMLGSTQLWLLGALAMVAIALIIWTTSTPPRFGSKR